jgi:hypothetical protein
MVGGRLLRQSVNLADARSAAGSRWNRCSCPDRSHRHRDTPHTSRMRHDVNAGRKLRETTPALHAQFSGVVDRHEESSPASSVSQHVVAPPGVGEAASPLSAVFFGHGTF